jgi:hypothetical protein
MKSVDEVQIKNEINWLQNKLTVVSKPKHRKDLERQIKEREYELLFRNKIIK